MYIFNFFFIFFIIIQSRERVRSGEIILLRKSHSSLRNIQCASGYRVIVKWFIIDVLAVLNETRRLSSPNSITLTLLCKAVFSLSDAATLSLRVCNSYSISSTLGSGIFNRCSYISLITCSCSSNLSLMIDAVGEPLNLLRGDRRSTGIEDKTRDTSVVGGGEVVRDLHLIRDGLTDADGRVSKDDDESNDGDDSSEEDDENSNGSNGYQVDNGRAFHQAMAAL
nr:hypothetical protein [Tanacetum cinerariifolium]